MRAWYAAPLLLLWGCSSHFAALQGNRGHDVAIEDLRTEVADLRHELHATAVEFHLLEEKLDAPAKPSSKFEEEIASLKRKIALLEKEYEKTVSDLRKLAEHANQTTLSLSQMQGAAPAKNYKVKPGDSLEKIARAHHVSVERLKELNRLNSDRIFSGQVLELPPHE